MPTYAFWFNTPGGDRVETRDFDNDRGAIEYARLARSGIVKVYRDKELIGTVRIR